VQVVAQATRNASVRRLWGGRGAVATRNLSVRRLWGVQGGLTTCHAIRACSGCEVRGRSAHPKPVCVAVVRGVGRATDPQFARVVAVRCIGRGGHQNSLRAAVVRDTRRLRTCALRVWQLGGARGAVATRNPSVRQLWGAWLARAFRTAAGHTGIPWWVVGLAQLRSDFPVCPKCVGGKADRCSPRFSY